MRPGVRRTARLGCRCGAARRAVLLGVPCLVRGARFRTRGTRGSGLTGTLERGGRVLGRYGSRLLGRVRRVGGRCEGRSGVGWSPGVAGVIGVGAAGLSPRWGRDRVGPAACARVLLGRVCRAGVRRGLGRTAGMVAVPGSVCSAVHVSRAAVLSVGARDSGAALRQSALRKARTALLAYCRPPPCTGAPRRVFLRGARRSLRLAALRQPVRAVRGRLTLGRVAAPAPPTGVLGVGRRLAGRMSPVRVPVAVARTTPVLGGVPALLRPVARVRRGRHVDVRVRVGAFLACLRRVRSRSLPRGLPPRLPVRSVGHGRALPGVGSSGARSLPPRPGNLHRGGAEPSRPPRSPPRPRHRPHSDRRRHSAAIRVAAACVAAEMRAGSMRVPSARCRSKPSRNTSAPL
ncbi:hypothetical protein EKD16_01975 [Streptomonospora litoralis]|uniref:Uncharacterized protein n=1 Tax=Streptomonospora litoralis TaxID=2498135 RepID=A0A4P6PZ87_9ACTN|nr:hypothetical protein EKD16_01975 [Streptomonospora litoralis]